MDTLHHAQVLSKTAHAKVCPAGLSVESSKEEALQAELSLVQAEEAALPLKIAKLQEALALESAKLQRREAGAKHLRRLSCFPVCLPKLLSHVTAIQEEEKVRQRKMAQLRHSLEVFRNRLGLYFKQAPGRLLKFRSCGRQHAVGTLCFEPL